MKKTLYDDLGVKNTATKQEIAKAYKTLAKKYHPDLQTSEKAKKKAEKEMIQINVAYETLKDEVKRREYDNQLIAEEEARRQAVERARQEATNRTNNVNIVYTVNPQYQEIRYEYVSPLKRIKYDLWLKILLILGIITIIFGIAMIIPQSRAGIINCYKNNIIFKIFIDVLNAIKVAFDNTWSFIKQNIGKGTF